MSGELSSLSLHHGELVLVEIDKVDLVDRRDEMLDAQKLCDPGVPTGLPQHSRASVDQKDRHVCVRGTGEHVAGVALVTRGVCQDVTSAGSGEEAVGDIDGDALLSFGAQTVG